MVDGFKTLPWNKLRGSQMHALDYHKFYKTCIIGFYQCYKYRVGEYIVEGPKRNYRIYRRKCRQTSAIYRQNKKYKNIKKYKNSKNYGIFEKITNYRHKIGKYRDKIGKYRYILEKIGKYRDQIGKKSPKNRGKYRGDILPIYRQ